ncbi:HD domain-containing protein [bacterium]|nr:HD domain-containing protein [bacterium]
MTEIIVKERIEELITKFARAVQIARIYTEDHHLTEDTIDHLYQILDDILLEKREITIGIIGDELAFEKEPLYELSSKKKGFIKHLQSIGVEKISFLKGLEKNELFKLIKILIMKSDSFNKTMKIEKRFDLMNFKHIAIGDIGFVSGEKYDPTAEEHLKGWLQNKSQKNIKLLTKTFKELKGNQSLNVQSAKQIVDSLINNLLKNKNLLLMLTSMKGYDENTFEHGINVGIFTLLQAEMIGLEQKYMADVGVAALLHDIGKLTGPVETFNEKEETQQIENSDKEENQILQDIKGAKILLETEDISVLPAIVAFEHHIQYDGSGGPKKLYGKELNLVSMMITISDYYDQLRRKPSYYEEGGPEKAYEEMIRLSGKSFHPDLLNNFFSVIGVYPPGTLVELDTKEVGLVIQSSIIDNKRPQVEILYDQYGEKLKDPFIVNLIEKNNEGKYKKTIVKSISPLD